MGFAVPKVLVFILTVKTIIIAYAILWPIGHNKTSQFFIQVFQVRFSDWLRRVMNSKALSQSQAADLFGVSQTQISSWLSGKASPSLASVELIAEALDCLPEDVLGEVYGRPKGSGSVITLNQAISVIEALDPDDCMVVCAELLSAAVEKKRLSRK